MRWVRRSAIVGVALVGAAVVLVGAMMGVRATTAKPRPFPDVAERVAAVVAQTRVAVGSRDEPDKWPALIAVMADIESVGDRVPPDLVWGSRPPDYSRVTDPDPAGEQLTPEQRESLVTKSRRALVQLESEGTLGRVWALSEAKRFDRPIEAGPDEDFTHNSPCRMTARMLRADMFVAAESGDLARAHRSFEAMLAIARALSQQASIIDHLVSWAISGLALDSARTIVGKMALSEEDAREWLAAIDRQRPSIAGVVGSIRRERIEDELMLSQFYAESGRLLVTDATKAARSNREIYQRIPASSAGLGTKLLSTSAGNALGDFYEDWDDSLEALDRYVAVLEKAAVLSKEERLRQGIDPAAALRKLHSELVVGCVVHGFDLVTSSDLDRANREATRLILAISAYRARHGEVPTSLADLAGEFIAEIPSDPITGGQWGYKRRKPNVRDAREYLLYSFWADGQDNEGRSAEPDGHSPLAEDAIGLDRVFNPPIAPK